MDAQIKSNVCVCVCNWLCCQAFLKGIKTKRVYVTFDTKKHTLTLWRNHYTYESLGLSIKKYILCADNCVRVNMCVCVCVVECDCWIKMSLITLLSRTIIICLIF